MLASDATSARSRLIGSAAGGSVLAACLLIAAMLATAWNIRAGSLSSARIAAFDARSGQVEAILSAMKDMETGERGYIISGDVGFLEPYHLAERQLSGFLADATHRNAANDLPVLRSLVQAKLDVAAKAIALRHDQGLDAATAFIRAGQDKQTMDAVRDRVAELRQSFADRSEGETRRANLQSLLLTLFSSVLALLACAWFAWLAISRQRKERATNALLEGVMANAPVGLGFLDRSLAIRHVNHAMAVMNAQALGANVGTGLFVALPQLRAELEGRLADVVQAGATVADIEVQIEPAEGEAAFCYLASFYPLRRGNERNEIDGAGIVVTDISDRKRSEEAIVAARDAAEEANRAKSTFIANMSHELRTPLSAIIGYSEMLQEEIEDGSDSKTLAADMAKIESNARHLLGLINDVLDLSKVESGKMEVFAESFDIAAMARDVAATVENLIAKKNNRLDIELADGLGRMDSDVTKIRQIVLNLLSNAAKFTQDGVITLSLARLAATAGNDMEWLELRVADTGIGMSAEQLAKLFQRFQQVDASTTRKFGGTGLGLSLTKAFSAMLGGEVGVESTAGQGSCFTVKLPISLAKAQALAAAHGETLASDAHEPAPTRETVLVIDDDPAQRELMTRFLEREGFATLTAPTGEAGIEIARRRRPRAVLLDVMMPGMDGWSVLSTLKADPETAKIPVVMVTFTSERGLASSLGAADYVPKPVEWEQFKHVMDRFREAEGDVLVVDDDADMRHRLRTTLEKDGWTVEEAGNGREALEVVRRATPRLILLDLTMPVMDGFSFLHALREEPCCADVPVVVLTARDLSSDDRNQLRSADRVLNKADISLRELAGQLRALAPAAEGGEGKG